MSDISLDLRGLVFFIFCAGLALFFLLAALISYLALRRARDRERWRPRIGVSLLFALGSVFAMFVPTTRDRAGQLDDSVQIWVPAVLATWLAVLVWLTRQTRVRARRPSAG